LACFLEDAHFVSFLKQAFSHLVLELIFVVLIIFTFAGSLAVSFAFELVLYFLKFLKLLLFGLIQIFFIGSSH